MLPLVVDSLQEKRISLTSDQGSLEPDQNQHPQPLEALTKLPCCDLRLLSSAQVPRLKA